MKQEEILKRDWVKDLIHNQCAFALFRLPHAEEPSLIIQTKGKPLELNDYSELNDKCGFVFAPFVITEGNPLLLIQEDIRLSGWQAIGEWVNSSVLSSEAEQTYITPVREDEPGKSYDEVFDTFICALRNGQFDKLVLSRFKDLKSDIPSDVMHLFESASEQYPNAFVYLAYTPQAGLWMGSTPEILLDGKSNNYATVALAGTMKASEKPVWSEKNKLEQDYVARYIREKLRSLGIIPHETGPVTAKAGGLIHLKTVFHFSFTNNARLGDVITLLHPTPAVCGLPKEEAYRFICAHEGYDRTYYSGFLGPLNQEKDTHLYVNLRCMRITSSSIRLYAGGGLLTSSDSDSEWNETEDKMQTMLSLLIH